MKDEIDREIKVKVEGRSYLGKRVQKALIVDVLKMRGPMGAYELLKTLDEIGFKISPSSLYSLLREMVEEGILAERDGKYEVSSSVHLDRRALYGLKLVEAVTFNKEVREFLKVLLETLAAWDEMNDEERKALEEKLRRWRDELKEFMR